MNLSLSKFFAVLCLVCIHIAHSNAQSVMMTAVGNGAASFSGDGGQCNLAQLNAPNDVCLDAVGNLYIADAGNNRIRKINAVTNIITTIAGNGTSGYGTAGDGSPATNVAIPPIGGICVDLEGNVYFSGPSIIKKIDGITGVITTIAGNGTTGYSGDNQLATDAQLNAAQGISTDNSGNIYFADKFNHAIRKITVATGIITTIAGDGMPGYSGDGGLASLATFNHPSVICFNNMGDLFIADEDNYTIRKISVATGIITTVAGRYTTSGNYGDYGPATNASIGDINGICTDTAGNVYITDISCSCRKINAMTNIITTVAGMGHYEGYNGDGSAITSLMNHPKGVCYNRFSNSLIIADQNNNRIRKVLKPGTTTAVTEVPASFLPVAFPNPSFGTIHLRLPGNVTDAQCEIINVTGKRIYSAQLSAALTDIDMNNQPAGEYFLTVKSASGSNTQQITIR